MSEIALYNLLKRIPDATDDEAKEAVADVASAKDVATKADLQIGVAGLKTEIAEIKTELKYMRWVLGLLFVMNAAIFIKLFF